MYAMWRFRMSYFTSPEKRVPLILHEAYITEPKAKIRNTIYAIVPYIDTTMPALFAKSHCPYAATAELIMMLTASDVTTLAYGDLNGWYKMNIKS